MIRTRKLFVAMSAIILFAASSPADQWQRPYKSDDAAIALFHFERIMAKGKIYDSGTHALHGVVTKSVKLAPGKFKRCLQFNGVDSAMFLSRKVSLSAVIGTSLEFWLCPDTSPEEKTADTFAKVFEAGEHKFKLGGYDYFARHSGSVPTGAQWGVFFWKDPKVQVRATEGADMYIMCADSPFSSARQQLCLKRNSGKLLWRGTGGFAKNGKLQYRSILSKSVVWQKARWTHVKIECAPYPGKIRMYINGRLEGDTPIQALPPSHTFILGGSLQNGIPFAGKIDELRVKRIVKGDEFAFPYGTMETLFYEYTPGISLPHGFMPMNLESGRDKTGAETKIAVDGTALKLQLSTGGQGVFAQVAPPFRGKQYFLSLKVKGAGGRAIVKLTHSRDYKLADEAASKTLDGTWQHISCPLSNNVVFLEFTKPGTYYVDDMKVTEKPITTQAPKAVQTELPQRPFKKDATTILLWHLDRGPGARSGFPGGPKGRIHDAGWQVKGKFRACLKFAGKGVVETRIQNPQLPKRKLELWLNPAKTADKKPRVIFNEVESPGCSSVLMIENDGSLRYQRVYTGTANESVRSSIKISCGKWTHVAVHIDAPRKQVAFFINGTPAGNAEMPLSESISRFGLGGPTPSEGIPFTGFAGLIDEIRITRRQD